MKSFFSRFISLLFPETCVLCGKEDTSLCEPCVQRFLPAPYIEDTLIHSLFSYQDKKVRDAIHAFKFKHIKSIAEHFAPLIHETIQNIREQNLMLESAGQITLLPIPKMQSHISIRGFDAVSYLCKKIAPYGKNIYVVDTDSVLRTNTKAQVGLSREQRLVNMRNAFRIINKEALRGKSVCIVDDVMTTGSTLRELRKVCLEVGAKEVFAITIAH